MPGIIPQRVPLCFQENDMTSDGSVPADNGRTVYISGPMRGYPELNFPAFMRAALVLRNSGFNVINPAELNQQNSQDMPFSYYMRRDIQVLVEGVVTDIAVLPRWQASRGATIEVMVAHTVDLPLSTIKELPDDRAELVPFQENVLQEALRLVYGDRQHDYGHPLDDFTKTATLWSVVLQKPDVTPEQVALCMIAVKISRQINRPKRDNIVDGAGYFGTLAMVIEEKERRARAKASTPSA